MIYTISDDETNDGDEGCRDPHEQMTRGMNAEQRAEYMAEFERLKRSRLPTIRFEVSPLAAKAGAAFRDLEEALQRQIETILLGPTPAVGSSGWIRAVAGDALASVSQDPGTGAVSVVLHAGTPQERAREVEARLRAGGYDRGLFVDYTVRVAPETWDRITIGGVAMPPVPRYVTVAEVEAHLRAKRLEERRAREAPLVALVAAVPEGLDANGWRAAVLAANEYWRGHNAEGGWLTSPSKVASFEGWLRASLADTYQPKETSCMVAARDAYRRATHPQPARPAPHRHRAPGLPLDMGEG